MAVALTKSSVRPQRRHERNDMGNGTDAARAAGAGLHADVIDDGGPTADRVPAPAGQQGLRWEGGRRRHFVCAFSIEDGAFNFTLTENNEQHHLDRRLARRPTREIGDPATGSRKDMVLSAEERSQGFVRPVRCSIYDARSAARSQRWAGVAGPHATQLLAALSASAAALTSVGAGRVPMGRHRRQGWDLRPNAVAQRLPADR